MNIIPAPQLQSGKGFSTTDSASRCGHEDSRRDDGARGLGMLVNHPLVDGSVIVPEVGLFVCLCKRQPGSDAFRTYPSPSGQSILVHLHSCSMCNTFTINKLLQYTQRED